MLNDPTADETLQADAFQILLMAQPEKERTETVVAVFKEQPSHKLKVALAYLVLGEAALNKLRGSGLVLDRYSSITRSWSSRGASQPIIPDPPPGISFEEIEPLLDSRDPQVAAFAGYIAALFGEEDGLAPLLSFWQSQTEPTADLDRLVYRAIAVLDQPEHIPLLKEIYARREATELGVSDFYWTIRIMSGRDILGFRKQIRSEVGMESLMGSGRFSVF